MINLNVKTCVYLFTSYRWSVLWFENVDFYLWGEGKKGSRWGAQVCILSDIVIRLPLIMECTHSIFTLQRYQQTLSVSFVSVGTVYRCPDWLKDLHWLFLSSLLGFIIIKVIFKHMWLSVFHAAQHSSIQWGSGTMLAQLVLFTSWRGKMSLVASRWHEASLSESHCGNLWKLLIIPSARFCCLIRK